MENVNVNAIVSAVNGTLLCGDPDTRIEDISTNSKELNASDLFVPIIGERVDAHRFIEDALNVCAASFTQEHDMASEAMKASGKCVIQVENTLEAMQKLAKWYRDSMLLPIVGVTGSVGKTTTREMIFTALHSEKNVFQTQKNYNSQVGVPLTLAKLSKKDEIAVLEMGMSNPGEMRRLANMIRPDVAVITCIGVAHIEQLKSQENICAEKMKIAAYMNPDNVTFLNGDDPILMKFQDTLPTKVVTYGQNENCQYRATNVRIEDNESVFTMQYPDGAIEVRLQAMGEHNVRNALVALAVADYYGVSVEQAAKALRHFQGQRQKVIKTPYFTMIDDTYNASPDSMKAAIRVLRDMPGEGKKIAVLADMLELGEKTKVYHREVGEEIAASAIDCLIGYGELAKEIEQAATSVKTMHADNLEEVRSLLEQEAAPEDIVLFKGSNGMKLSTVTKSYLE